jgi:protocatechuate 3,4-dioxygenase beta subunit
MRTPRSRRQILGSALASGSLLSLVDPLSTFAENATPTPQCHDNHETTIRQTEGPYFKPSSPERADLVEPDTTGRPVEIDGQVTTRSCRPVARALVDLWHADENGEYDNSGFRYRGHLLTDAEGRYRFRTIVPEQALLTTQLYFPDEPANRRDVLFRRDLVMRVAEAPEGLKARFDFVLNMR